MRQLIFVLLGMLGAAGTVFGQHPLTPANPFSSPNPPPWKLHWQGPAVPGLDGVPADDFASVLAATPNGYVRNLAPDQMRCFFPNLTEVEKMPCLRSRNGDPMAKPYPGRQYNASPAPDFRR